MLDRKQLLLEDWQSDYVEELSAKYNRSLSEIVRRIIDGHILDDTNVMTREYDELDFEARKRGD